MSLPGDPLAFICKILKAAEIGHALIGGHAVNAWVEPRFTADVDLTVEADPGAIATVVEALQGEGYRVKRTVGDDLPSGPDFLRLVSDADEPPLDLQVAKTAFQLEVIRRARRSEGGLNIATPEDLIVLKLIAHRTKDLIDLQTLIAIPNLDWPYIERWAEAWEVADRLDALRER